MEGPSTEIRAVVASRVNDLLGRYPPDHIDSDLEDALAEILEDVAGSCLRDVADDGRVWTQGPQELSSEDAEQLLATVHAWASVASYVTARVYGPNSPMCRTLAGWGSKVAGILQKIAGVLLTPLRLAAHTLGATSWTIGVNFPWTGVSVSLTWP